MTCIFCRIARGEVPSQVVYQDEEIFAFRDVNPQAPTHVLIIPRKHIAGLQELSPDDSALVARLILAAPRIAEAEGIAATGYRLVANMGPDAGQVVQHLHFHLLGGRPLRALC